MRNIEFLPPRYGQRGAARRGALRRAAALAGLVVVIACASAWQFAQERTARRELAAAQARYAAAQASVQRLEQLRMDLEKARAAAELCVLLKHPWPRTPLLAAVAGALPLEVELAELHITRERTSPNPISPSAQAGRRASPERDTEKIPLAAGDVRRLREETEGMQTVVRLSGAAFAPGALHRFVADLNHHPLFARAELGSLETVEVSERGLVTQFAARVVARSEFGGAPNANALAAELSPPRRTPK